MPITITSGGVTALCAAIALLGGFGLWAVQAIVAREMRKLNGRYLFSNGSKLTGHEIEQRFVSVDGRLAQNEADIRGISIMRKGVGHGGAS